MWANQHFLICNNHIKNNSYINLDGGSHIRIVWSCRNAVKTHNEIYSIKILATGRPVAKYLIKYNNSLEENEDVKKEPINIKFIERKKDPYNDENAIDFKWSGVQEDEEYIVFWLTSFRITKTNWWENFSKKTGWLFDDCGIVPNEKKI